MAERYFKTEALVLHSRPLGEADRLITMLSWEQGKLAAVARGARKIKSKLAAGVDLFTYGDYQFYRGRGLAVITGAAVKEHFTRFREQPELYPYALFLAELAGRLAAESEPCPHACGLLLEAWRLLAAEQALDRELFCRAYELRLLDLSGYRPYFHACLGCGTATAVVFSPRQGGLLCRACAPADGIVLDPATVALARRLLEAPLRQVKLLRPQARQKAELATVTASFMRFHLDIAALHSLRLLPGRENRPG